MAAVPSGKQIKTPAQMNRMVNIVKKRVVIITLILTALTIALIVACCVGKIEKKTRYKALFTGENSYEEIDELFESYTPDGQQEKTWIDFYGLEKADKYATYVIFVPEEGEDTKKINTGLSVIIDGETKGVTAFNGLSVFFTYDEIEDIYEIDETVLSEAGVFPGQSYKLVYLIAPEKRDMKDNEVISCEVIAETISLSELIVK